MKVKFFDGHLRNWLAVMLRKIIKATLSSEDNIKDSIKSEKSKTCFPEVVISVPARNRGCCSRALQNFAVDDLTIEEVPIEDVIRKVFKGSCASKMS